MAHNKRVLLCLALAFISLICSTSTLIYISLKALRPGIIAWLVISAAATWALICFAIASEFFKRREEQCTSYIDQHTSFEGDFGDYREHKFKRTASADEEKQDPSRGSLYLDQYQHFGACSQPRASTTLLGYPSPVLPVLSSVQPPRTPSPVYAPLSVSTFITSRMYYHSPPPPLPSPALFPQQQPFRMLRSPIYPYLPRPATYKTRNVKQPSVSRVDNFPAQTLLRGQASIETSGPSNYIPLPADSFTLCDEDSTLADGRAGTEGTRAPSSASASDAPSSRRQARKDSVSRLQVATERRLGSGSS